MESEEENQIRIDPSNGAYYPWPIEEFYKRAWLGAGYRNEDGSRPTWEEDYRWYMERIPWEIEQRAAEIAVGDWDYPVVLFESGELEWGSLSVAAARHAGATVIPVAIDRGRQ